MVPDDSLERTRQVVTACEALGFAAAGVCRAEPSSWADQLKYWLAAGKQGEMDWLDHTADVRLDPERFLPGVRSLILVLDQYAAANEPRPTQRPTQPQEAPAGAARPAGRTGRIARYARLGSADYHKSMSSRLRRVAEALESLHPNERFRTFVDVMPVLEREHAARAGLGWIAKHTLLIHPDLGSYVTLGGIATTLELAEGDGTSSTRSPVPDHCGACTRCIDACPTRAISPYSVNASRCISYLTIEHEDRVDPAFHAAIDNWLIGCDICQEVCPHNHRSEAQRPRADQRVTVRSLPRSVGSERADAITIPEPSAGGELDLLELLGWSEHDRSTRLTSSAIKRLTLSALKRNALIAAGNRLRQTADPELETRMRTIATDAAENPLLRQTAQDVLDGLSRRTPSCNPPRTS